MEKRKEINDKLVRWIAEKVKREYADDISLVLIYGSYVNGTANSRSDVDCCFVPKTGRGYELSRGAIIDGVGYDIFPMPWERLEQIADLQESLSPLVGDAKIIYSGCGEDAGRFRELQARLRDHLQRDDYVREIAAERCREAGKLCGQLRHGQSLSEIRKTAGMAVMTLADAVAAANHDYFHFGLKRQFEDLQHTIPAVPQNVVDGYRAVVEASDADEVIERTKRLLEDVCQYLGAAAVLEGGEKREIPAVRRTDAGALAELYEEICSSFNKIYVCCETGNAVLAFLSGVCLQRDLDDAAELGWPACELLASFSHRNLRRFSEAARKTEEELVRLITENGGHIRRYDSFEQFALENR